MFFLSVPKMKSTPKECLETKKKGWMLKINICDTSTNSQIFEFIWFHMFATRNNEDMESQSPEHFWSNYNPLVLGAKSSSYIYSNCDTFF